MVNHRWEQKSLSSVPPQAAAGSDAGGKKENTRRHRAGGLDASTLNQLRVLNERQSVVRRGVFWGKAVSSIASQGQGSLSEI